MSDRLLAVIQGYSEGLRQEAIAKRLGVSQFTVSKQLTKDGLNQQMVLQLLREGKSPEEIVASVRPGQPSLPLDLADENKRLRQEMELLHKLCDKFSVALCIIRDEVAVALNGKF